MISFYTSTPLDMVEQWPYKKWRNVLAHIAVIRQREKTDSLHDNIEFENMKRGK